MHTWMLIGLMGLVVMVAPMASARGDEEDEPLRRSITVNGSGRLMAAPDTAEISVGVVTQAKTAREALSANNAAMGQIQGVLKERGVEPKDIQTSNINIQPQYSQPNQIRPGEAQEEFVPRIRAYQVTNTVHITVRTLTELGTILDSVVEAGANQIYGISFRIDKPEELQDEARRKAMADARKKAETLAEAESVKVGPPVTINESGGFSPGPRPMAAPMMRSMAASVPVSEGEQEVRVDVNVVYELIVTEQRGK